MPIALAFFVQYAYLIIFLWVLVEQMGIPIPSVPVLLTAGTRPWGETSILAGRFFGDLAKKSAPFFAWLGHFAIVIFVAMVLGFLAHRIWKQRKFLQQVRELRLEPFELKTMLDLSVANHTPPPFIVDLRHPLDYLPDPRVLPGALRIGPNELKQHSEIIPRDRDVILYCTC